MNAGRQDKLSERVYCKLTSSQLERLNAVAMSLSDLDSAVAARERSALIRRFVMIGVGIYERRLISLPGIKPIVGREIIEEAIDREIAKELV